MSRSQLSLCLLVSASILLADGAWATVFSGKLRDKPALQTPETVCFDAARRAEVRHNLPRLILVAIGAAESGRWDKQTGLSTPWPWTVTSGGPGNYFPTQAAALAHAEHLRRQGISNIDIGCFQINQHYHPKAFSSMDAGFDPDQNADYAATFLKKLRREYGSWTRAVAVYHSKTTLKGLAYRNRVYDHWQAWKNHERAEKQRIRTAVRDFRRLRQNYIKTRSRQIKEGVYARTFNPAAEVFANNSVQ